MNSSQFDPESSKATKSERMMPEYALVTSSLQPGDVVLMRDRSLVSGFIAFLSEGEYSHAALYLGGQLFLESDKPHFSLNPGKNLVGLNYLPNLGWVKWDGKASALVSFKDKTLRYAVYRHPGMAEKIVTGDFETASKAEISESTGLDYPEISALLPFVKFLGPKSQPIASATLNAFYSKRDQFKPGPFCSQLVAKVYARLNLPPFSEANPATFSPGSFANSVLDKVDGAVVSTAEVEFVERAQLDEFFKSFEEFAVEFYGNHATDIRGMRVFGDEVRQLAKKLKTESNARFAETIQQIRAGAPKNEKEIVQHVHLCIASKNPGAIRRARKLVALWSRVFDALPSIEQVREEDTEKLKQFSEDYTEASESYSRCEAILRSNWYRAASRQGSKYSRQELRAFRKSRVKLLRSFHRL